MDRSPLPATTEMWVMFLHITSQTDQQVPSTDCMCHLVSHDCWSLLCSISEKDELLQETARAFPVSQICLPSAFRTALS
ncbi:Disheveled-Associated Activator Of Morphogenesis 1 [Manis pentadactyla]|nr:Disheveled-Associated Activator Of Morphogenesis 1 [Manis pentadactyla]